MKYLILIYSNPASREMWASFSPEEQAEGYRIHAAMRDSLVASGELIASEALADASQAKRLSVRAGQPLTSDGPFAEAKETLAGFYLVECDSTERAVEIGQSVPEAAFVNIEVWPSLDPAITGY